jgi:hypothetical protein
MTRAARCLTPADHERVGFGEQRILLQGSQGMPDAE